MRFVKLQSLSSIYAPAEFSDNTSMQCVDCVGNAGDVSPAKKSSLQLLHGSLG